MLVRNMTRLVGAVSAAALSLVANAVSAAPVLGPNLNYGFYSSRENWLDLNVNGQVDVGDQFYGIFHVQGIENPFGNGIWGEDNITPVLDTFTGYFLQEVAATGPIDTHGTGTTADDTEALFFTPVRIPAVPVDPNLVLTTAEILSGVMMKLWIDTTTRYTASGPVATDILAAKDGTHYWSLGFQPTSTGVPFTGSTDYFYNLTAPVYPDAHFAGAPISVGTAQFGMSFIENHSPYTFGLVNDPSELLFDSNVGIYSSVKLADDCGPAPSLIANCNGGGPLQWRFDDQDPFVVNVTSVPEPGTISLFGMGLLGFGFMLSRRRNTRQAS